MASLLTVSGRDVLFAHWPVDRETLDPLVPDPLELEIYRGSAWVGVLALETQSVGPGSLDLPAGVGRTVPQLNLRTYVTVDSEPGVYFLSLDSASAGAATVGRRVFGLPFHGARMRMTRRGDDVTFRSRRTGDDGRTALFQARYRPRGELYRAPPDSVESACIEHYRYYLPASENRRLGVGTAVGSRDVVVGTIDRNPWELRRADATIRRNTLFETAGLPALESDPVVHYSPGFEMRLEQVE